MLKMILPILFLCLQVICALRRNEMTKIHEDVLIPVPYRRSWRFNRYICSLNVRPGNCRGTKIRRWYYNKDKKQCKPFVYGGCGGNANSFESEQQCIGTCGPICHQPVQSGHCKEYMPRYHFNNSTGTCQSFVYGGCGGNQNNFKTLRECQSVCKYECTLRPDPGPCKASMTRYYYNMETGNCELFMYGGCSGNANNYNEKKVCEARCVISMT